MLVMLPLEMDIDILDFGTETSRTGSTLIFFHPNQFYCLIFLSIKTLKSSEEGQSSIG